MKSQELKKFNLPDNPGVYFFYKGKDILYIGKATSLRDRVKSYFGRDLIATRGPLLVDMVVSADRIEYQGTDSVLEALILEAELIKKHQPRYNTKEKDNKSFNYVVFTKDKVSKVLVVRGRKLDKKNYKKVFGPFPNGLQLREAMRIVRKIFPYFDNHSDKKQNFQFYKQLSLIPEKDQEKNIRNLILFFQGKKKQVIVGLRKDMMAYAKKKEFERAGEIKKKIFALEHINDVALIKDDLVSPTVSAFEKVLGSPREGKKKGARPDHFQNHFPSAYRIEAYDIAHMSGKNMVGVMTVVMNGQSENSEYRKFIIETQKDANDTGALEEVLSRRFRHTEWGMPDLVVVDGGVAQVNTAKRVLSRYQFEIPVVGVIKDDRHKAKALLGDENIIVKFKKVIILANVESHRFAITFHRSKRNKAFL
ncbi:MAG: GIY-YIG nuclease family protein [Candidatus Nomurabacteria bacterium]|nr:GIY-YIG nuclease family protein [Candidatus Nomurabacteria bacterium]